MVKKIYIDPGHSNIDPGAVGHEVERDLNEKVSKFMNEYLLANYVCETKVCPITIDDPGDITADANAWGADLFVSNHFNAGGGDGYEALVYTQERVTLGQIFAKYIEEIGQNLRPYGAAPGVKIRNNLYVLKHTDMPAVLNESAFVDNWTDIKDWNDDSELKKMGEAFAKAAAEYLDLPKKNVVVTPEVKPVEKTETKVEIVEGDHVKISADAVYTNGKNIPNWVKNKVWIVKKVNGDVVVIDKDLENTHSINSPVKATYLSVVEPEAKPEENVTAFKSYAVRVTASALNVRKGPGVNYGINACIRDKGVYTIVEESNGWGKLKSGAGWISLDYTKKI